MLFADKISNSGTGAKPGEKVHATLHVDFIDSSGKLRKHVFVLEEFDIMPDPIDARLVCLLANGYIFHKELDNTIDHHESLLDTSIRSLKNENNPLDDVMNDMFENEGE